MLSLVVPVFVPSSFVETGSLPGPYQTSRARGVVLAWAALMPGDAVQYILHEMQSDWDAQGIDWKTRALQNLRERTPEPMASGALFRDNGETWLISLMHSDGLGPSRLLLTDELERLFPKGYRVAMPERNRGFAFAEDLDDVDTDTIESLIQGSYSRAEQPLSPEIFSPDHLLSATPSRIT